MANTYKALSSVTIGSGGATTISFTNIPQTYTDLVVKISARAANATNGYTLTVNDTDGNGRTFYGGSGSNGSFTSTTIPGLNITSGFPANYFSNGEWYIPNYASNVNNKSLQSMEVQENNSATAGSTYMYVTSSRTPVASPITKLTLTCGSGFNFAQHTTATLYGVFNADVSSAPATPTIGTATAISGTEATVTFTSVSNAASYTITSSPGNITATGTTSPITISGLTADTAYTFTIKSNNPFGSSAESSASNSITPYAGFYSISSTTLSSPTSTITFNNIPNNFKHLEIHAWWDCEVTNNNTWLKTTFNGDTTSNYAVAAVRGDGSGESNTLVATSNYLSLGANNEGSAGDAMASTIATIYDYSNTSKSTSIQGYSGQFKYTANKRQVGVWQGSWVPTTAVSSITITGDSNFSTNSRFSLYGIS